MIQTEKSTVVLFFSGQIQSSKYSDQPDARLLPVHLDIQQKLSTHDVGLIPSSIVLQIYLLSASTETTNRLSN